MKDLSEFSKRSSASGILWMTERTAASNDDIHSYLWHHIECDTRDLYRALHRASVRIFERHDDGFDSDTPIGLYADLDDDSIMLKVVSFDGVVCDVTLHLHEAQV